MYLRNILVHLDNSALCAERLKQAIVLAQSREARLVGLFAQRAQAQTVGTVSSWPSQAYLDAAARNKAMFEDACQALGDRASWRDANRGSPHEVIRVLIETAHHFDLVVVSQDDESSSDLLPNDLPEQVILNAGRPGLIIPYALSTKTLGKRPLFAWNGSREAVRALNDAIPLLSRDGILRIVTLGSPTPELQQSMDDLTAHLASHHITAEADYVPADGIGVMDMLLNQTVDQDADLLIMGASGSTGFANLRRRSGTRHILRHMTVPVLMSH